ncbi:hypothetical protein BY458DRAFT_409709, partial [Sporodiniella umbellata]
EKAYGWFHPTYLQARMKQFRFSNLMTNCVLSLFFKISLVINVNGFLSLPVQQLKGLRQG